MDHRVAARSRLAVPSEDTRLKRSRDFCVKQNQVYSCAFFFFFFRIARAILLYVSCIVNPFLACFAYGRKGSLIRVS